MMYVIENDELKVQINSRGAELTSVYSKKYGIDYLWKGDAAFWGKHSPVLFPIIGALKNNAYHFNGKEYTLPRHGFAREKDFEVIETSRERIAFALTHANDTLRAYPFLFEFQIHYHIKGSYLEIHYRVINKGEGPMYFSLGAHPAFGVPLASGSDYGDYYIAFDQKETLDRWTVSKEGLIEKESASFLVQQDRIPLTRELFYNDALVFKRHVSTSLSILSDKTARGLKLDMAGFPYLGIWAAKNADFVCLEPWCGIADSVDTNQQLVHKEGIEELEKGGVFDRMLGLSLF